MGCALERRGPGEGEQIPWLRSYRWEYNHVRPHEALGMKTPASRWVPSPRKYDPAQPPWVYPEGSKTLKIDCQGKVDINGKRWRIGKALQGQRVRLQTVEQRILVFYCTTLIREIDLVSQRSTMVDRWLTKPRTPEQV